MKHSAWQNRAAAIFFSVTAALFFLFFVYMGSAETVSVYHGEQTHSYSEFTDLEMELVRDDTAPVGMRKVYRGVLDPERSRESCLCFNIAHHSIQVYFGDVLQYSLSVAQSNRIGRNVSSNWCSVHVGTEHAGETVTIILTPLFEAAVGKNATFLLGSHYSIALDLLRGELPQMILCVLCVLLGLAVVAVFLYFRCILKTDTGGMVYLGLFSLLLGLWKLTDLPSMPMLLPDHAMALGYICLGSLFLLCPCLLLYLSTLFVDQLRRKLWPVVSFICAVCLAVLAMQVFGIREIRQNLVISHVLLIVSISALPAMALYNRVVHKYSGLVRSWRLLLLLFAGIALDLTGYYKNNDNATISFTVLGFVIYAMIVFLGMILNTTRKVNTDSLTGLVSRSRWNELTNTAALPESYGILMIDLNGLKKVNDTLGHDMGDQMIFRFSSILRNTLAPTSVICRWGGDEFAVLLAPAGRTFLEKQLEALDAAVREYNAECPELPIHYAAGAALSGENPGLSQAELFRMADENMYRNKQQWYSQKTAE